MQNIVGAPKPPPLAPALLSRLLIPLLRVQASNFLAQLCLADSEAVPEGVAPAAPAALVALVVVVRSGGVGVGGVG